MTSNEKEGVCYPQPKSLAQRVAIANDFTRRFHYEIPMVVDRMDNGANVSGSQRRMKNGTTNFLNYNLYVDSARTNAWTTATSNAACAAPSSCFLGTGSGSSQSVNIYGRVPSTGTAPPTGTYTDTVTMTVTY